MDAGRREMTADERLLLFELDSVRQQQAFTDTDTGPRAALERLVGQVRLALLLRPQVFLTHAMLLDGRMFRTLGPRDLAAAIGVEPHRLPFTVLAVDGDLRASLRASLDNERYLWQTRPPEGDDPHVGEWLDAADRGWFHVIPYPQARPQPGEPFLTATVSESELASVDAETARVWREAAVATTRSDAYRALASLPDTAAADDARAWFEREYLQEIARRNDAAWLAFDDPADSLPGRRELSLPATLLTYCTQASASGYGAARWGARALIEEFESDPTAPRLRSLAFGFINAVRPQTSLRSTAAGALLRLVLALATIAIAFLSLPGLGTGGELAIVAFVVLVLTTLPWQDLGTLRAVREISGGAKYSVSVAGRAV